MPASAEVRHQALEDSLVSLAMILIIKQLWGAIHFEGLKNVFQLLKLYILGKPFARTEPAQLPGTLKL